MNICKYYVTQLHWRCTPALSPSAGARENRRQPLVCPLAPAKAERAGVRGSGRFPAHSIVVPALAAQYPHINPLYTPCIPTLNPV
jgi:hypothetical protein